MKVALINDNHAGARGDNKAFRDKAKLFFDNIFFPYIDKEKINTVIHLGDLVDRRKYINIGTAMGIREDFLDPLSKRNCIVHFIAGNHDVFFKNTNEVNSLKELILGRYKNFYIYDMNAQEIILDDLSVLLIPWICEENRQRIFKKIENTQSQIAFGHLELKGFEMVKGIISSTGDDVKLFEKFDIVYSGHFHSPSVQQNIHYLGSCLELTWADHDDLRGFSVFDTETRETKFISNDYKMFKKIWYDESDDIKKLDFSQFQSCIVKVVVGKKTDVFAFEKFIDTVERQNPLVLQVVEDQGLASSMLSDNIDETESTLNICMSYIDNIDLSNKGIEVSKLKNIVTELYHDALTHE